MAVAHDPVLSPSHYRADNGLEAYDVFRAFGFLNNWHRATALKYLFRADKKGRKVEDLRKAIWHIEREIERTLEHKPTIEEVADRAPPACPDTDDTWCNPPAWTPFDPSTI